MSNIIKASFGAMKRVRTRPVWRIDHGMILQFAGLDLPQAYEVHFSNSRTKAAKIVVGDENGVVIPSEYFKNADQIFAWLYLHTGEDDGWTAYEVEIPLQLRPDTTPEQPTPDEQSAIEQAITALNRAVETTGEDVIAANAAKDAAADSAAEALGSADSAQGSARSAASDADRAETAKGLAENAAQTAEAAKTAAVAAKEGAEAAVAGFDADVEHARGEITQLVSEAGEAAEAAGDSAAAAGQAASVARQKASEASASAGAAAQSESTAVSKAEEASDSASAAASSAALAAQKATDAGGSATAAQTAQTAAEAAQTAAETAQTAAEQAAQSISDAAAQIQKNTDDILSIYPTETASGSIASFADGADGVPVKSLLVNIEPVQSGSGDPAPENVRPISGWDAVDVLHLSQNMMDGVPFIADSYYANNGQVVGSYNTKRVGQYLPVTPGKQYVLGWQGYATVARLRVHEYAADQTWLQQVSSDFGNTAVWTASSDAAFIRFSLGTVAENVVLGEGDHYTIDLPQTVYGGTLDVASGVLSIDYAIHAFDGTETSWVVNGSALDASRQVFPAAKLSSRSYIGLCSHVKSVNGNVDPTYLRTTQNPLRPQFRQIVDYWGVEQTSDAWNAYLAAQYAAGTPVQLCYELATPTIAQLTPTEVTTLLGVNNIWADTGDVDVTYRADVQLYIQRLTQPAEDDRIANANIPANTYFLVGNTLYFSTAAIAAGETIAPGTNCTETNLAAALNALNA